MPLPAGTRLGPYEILAPLGAGGMGEVYSARDTRLDRTVAIKVLPPHVLDEPGLRARFEREARVASSLDHPNICVLHDVGREGTLEYIVMQHLEGETLADRLTRGPLPLDEALRYATEIAAALDKAHRAGILHRDIKPGNVMLVKSAGRDTSAKLLDFGLAKSLAPVVRDRGGDAPQTATSPLTGRGTIVGTLLYMSPEQLEGRDVDARSDIFSFGAVLYEMVTGRRAFDAGSQPSIIAAILEREPAPISAVTPLTPPSLDRVVRKCLAKDRDRRWQSAADLCDELSWIAQSSSAHQTAVVRQPARSWRLPIAAVAATLAIVALAAGLAWALRQKPETATAVARDLAIVMPEGLHLSRGGIAVAPDGRSVVFVASSSPPVAEGLPTSRGGSTAQLYLRRMDATAVTAIAGTEGARAPFFAPDGQTIGYFTAGGLWKVSLRGGQPQRLGGTPPVTRGGAWLADGSIVVAPTHTSGLVRFSPDGKAAPLTTLDAAGGELGHLWPHAMPNGQDVLFTIRRGTSTDMDASDIGLLNAATGARRIVFKGAAFGQYSPTGHLLFVRGRTLSAVPFDPRNTAAEGTAIPIAEQLALDPWAGGAHYANARDGALVLLRGTFPERRTSAVWVSRAGKSTPLPGFPGFPAQPRISPDGSRAVFDAPSPDGDDEVFLADLARGTSVRLSADPQDDFNPVWSRDGRLIVWTALPPGRLPHLVMQPADGTGTRVEIGADPEAAQFPGSVSPDGLLAYTRATAAGAFDIWVVPLTGERKARPFLATAAEEFSPEFSPDGKWIAYMSNESGMQEVYVAPFPGPGGKHRVTNGGGASPAWSRNGGELFYQVKDALMVVAVGRDGTFGAPRKVFDGPYVIDNRQDGPRGYDVAPDGTRFLMLVPELVPAPPPAFHVLLDWTVRARD